MRNRNRALLADLDIFVTILTHGSMKRAALELGVSVSALSHRMRKLEDQVGVRLLNRASRSLSATVAGERLAKQLTAGFTTIDEALTSLARQRDNPAGRLRINVLQDAARLLQQRNHCFSTATKAPIERLTAATRFRWRLGQILLRLRLRIWLTTKL